MISPREVLSTIGIAYQGKEVRDIEKNVNTLEDLDGTSVHSSDFGCHGEER